MSWINADCCKTLQKKKEDWKEKEKGKRDLRLFELFEEKWEKREKIFAPKSNCLKKSSNRLNYYIHLSLKRTAPRVLVTQLIAVWTVCPWLLWSVATSSNFHWQHSHDDSHCHLFFGRVPQQLHSLFLPCTPSRNRMGPRHRADESVDMTDEAVFSNHLMSCDLFCGRVPQQLHSLFLSWR